MAARRPSAPSRTRPSSAPIATGATGGAASMPMRSTQLASERSTFTAADCGTRKRNAARSGCSSAGSSCTPGGWESPASSRRDAPNTAQSTPARLKIAAGTGRCQRTRIACSAASAKGAATSRGPAAGARAVSTSGRRAGLGGGWRKGILSSSTSFVRLSRRMLCSTPPASLRSKPASSRLAAVIQGSMASASTRAPDGRVGWVSSRSPAPSLRTRT